MSYLYLASPYSDPDPEVRQARYEAVCAHIVGLTVVNRIVVFSPIMYWHEVASKQNMPYKAKDWLWYNKEMLKSASRLEILMLAGWDDSKGVQAEFDLAMKLNIPTAYVPPRRADGTLIDPTKLLDAASVR